MNHPRPCWIGVFMLLLSTLPGLLAAAAASDRGYELVVLASSANWFGDAQINNAGKVVFLSSSSVWAGVGLSAAPLVTANMPTEGISELLVDVSNGHVALNDAGTIAFVGVDSGGNHALYVSTRIGWSKAFTRVGVMLTDPSINNTGEISILMYTDAEEGIYLLKKDTIAPVIVAPSQNGFVGLANENDLNERGQIVYRAEPPNTIVLVDRGQHRVVALTASLQFSLNNSGHVAVADDAGVTLFSPLQGTSQQISRNPTYTVSLADSGDVAFADGSALMFSQNASGASVVRTAVPVVQVGDVVDGAQVISIDMHRRSLNSMGEIVLVVALSDGRHSVMLARPSHP